MGLRILQHERKTRLRILRIQRHIRAACLQDAQQGHDHLHRTLQQHTHAHFRADAQLAQVVRQLIRTFIQFRVRQTTLVTAQRNLFRRPLHLRFK
jgi:hypothetical protein